MTKTELTKYEKAILLFYLKGTLSDLSKALIFFFIFYILGLHKEILWGLFFLLIFRVFSGGIHCKTYIRCLLLSFVILSSGVMLGSFIFLPKHFSIPISFLCGMLTIIFSPVLASSRPVLTTHEIKQAKIHEGIVLICFEMLFIFSEAKSYLNIGFWILVIHTIQLIVAYVRR